jgi:TolB protein
MKIKQISNIVPVLLCGWCLAAPAQDSIIQITRDASKVIPISITGVGGEVESVLKFDLSVMGMEVTAPEKADYLISGVENGRLEGRLKQAGGNADIFARAYSGGSLRSQAHSFADDIARTILDTAPIFHSKIAFCREADGSTEICVADFDGNNQVEMTRDGSLVATPAWAPGGRTLFYTSWRNGATQILEHDVTSGARRVFAAFGGANFNPVVSPDGGRVAMILSKGGTPSLYVCDRSGGGLRQLSFGRDEASSPTWSPDGREICYVVRSGRATLRRISSQGGEPGEVRTGGVFGNVTSPDWSPDGKKIIFTSGSGNFTLCVVPAEGGNAESLVDGEDPCWAPNSRTVIFTRRANHNKVLSLLDVPTKHVKDITQISGSCSQPAWAR